jgi:hypothetical protein
LYSEGKCWKATCSDPIVFRLLDKATQQNLIFGTNSKYKLDSLQLNKRPDFRIGQYDNLLSEVSCDSERLFTASGEYADTSYLRLTHTDIDTLVINYIRENNQCCVPYGGYGKIGLIKYNGKVAQKNGDIFKFEKE